MEWGLDRFCLFFFVAVAFVKPVYISIPAVCISISLGFSIQVFLFGVFPPQFDSITKNKSTPTKKLFPFFSPPRIPDAIN